MRAPPHAFILSTLMLVHATAFAARTTRPADSAAPAEKHSAAPAHFGARLIAAARGMKLPLHHSRPSVSIAPATGDDTVFKARIPKPTFGDRIADKVASFGGSWKFIWGSSAVMAAWMFVNGTGMVHFDPAPFMGLNLVLSTVAALQAPIILMSQNRQAVRDRAYADADFRVNLHANAQVDALHISNQQLQTKLDEMNKTLTALAAKSGVTATN